MSIDMAALRSEYDRLANPASGGSRFLDNFIQMPDGEGNIVVRLLWPRQGLRLPFCSTRTHKLNGKSFHCPCTNMGGRWEGRCPICNRYRSLWKQSDSASEGEAKALQAEARSIKPTERFYWNGIVRKLVKPGGEVELNAGPMILSCGVQLHKKILLGMFGDPKLGIEELGDVTHPQAGRDLRIVKRLVKSGNEAYPNYNESVFLAVGVAGSDADMLKWTAALHDLEALRQVKTFDELKRELDIHMGLIEDPDTSFSAPSPPVEEAPAPKPQPVAAQTKVIPTPPSKSVPKMEDLDESGDADDFIARLRGSMQQ